MSVPEALFFAPALDGGGAEMHLLRVLNALDRSRIEPVLAVSRPNGSYDKSLDSGIRKISLLPERSSSSTRDVIASVAPLSRLIRDLGPKLMFSIMEHGNAAALLARRLSRLEVPLVLGVQVNPVLAYQGSSPLHLGLKALQKYGYQHAQSVVALSTGVARELEKANPALRGKVRVIPNAGVDERVWRAAENPVPRDGVVPGEKLIVACGRLTAQKDYPMLLQAMVLLRHQVKAKLWIMGEGPDREALTALRDRLDLSETVKFLGFQSDPFRVMAAADVFVLSSIYEGFGNVIIEAMGAGAPVVSTDCDYGPGEIIKDGENGILVPVSDARRLAQALERVLTDHDLALRLKRNGATRARDFEPARIARQYLQHFLDVMRTAKAREK